MQKFTQKWTIISLLDDMPEGTTFYHTDFPLHVTLAGVFAIDLNGKRLAKGLSGILQSQLPVTIKATNRVMFGKNKDIPVVLVDPTPALVEFYHVVYGWLEEQGARYNEPQYQAAGWLPHSTVQKNGRGLPAGDTRQLTSVSLVDMFPDGDGYQRKIVKTVTLSSSSP